jgi:hypothetical protein
MEKRVASITGAALMAVQKHSSHEQSSPDKAVLAGGIPFGYGGGKLTCQSRFRLLHVFERRR